MKNCSGSPTTSSSNNQKANLSNGYLVSKPEIVHAEEEVKTQNNSNVAKIEVIVIQNHVNLKIHCRRRPGQLLKAIVALEDIRLTFLHLNISSTQESVHYSFNLRVLYLFNYFYFVLLTSSNLYFVR